MDVYGGGCASLQYCETVLERSHLKGREVLWPLVPEVLFSPWSLLCRGCTSWRGVYREQSCYCQCLMGAGE